MTQSRIVLRDTALERGQRLLEATGLGTLTELINVMFTRYGRHLEETWEVVPVPSAQYSAMPEIPPDVASTPLEADFNFDEPLTGL